MAQVSPGVEINEVDLTTVVPAVSTNIGGFVGSFRWGPVEEVTLVSSEDILGKKFGQPGTGVATDFLIASQFLAYSSALRVVRVLGKSHVTSPVDTATNAVAAVGDKSDSLIDDILIKNYTQIENELINIDSNVNTFIAKYPGIYGNGLKVVVLTPENFDKNSSDDDIANASSLFDSVPVGSEIHIAVFDGLGTFTGVVDAVLETYSFVSTSPTSKTEDGSTNYYRTILNTSSAYLYAGIADDLEDIESADLPSPVTGNIGVYVLSNGTDGETVTDADKISGWDLFKNSETVDVTFLFTGASSANVSAYVANNICAIRKDCVVTISPEKSDVVGAINQLTNVLGFRTSLNLNTSYAIIDGNWKQIYNKYADRYEWVPTCADIAGLLSRLIDVWFSPAGLNRGILKNVIKLAWNPDKADRDELYKNGVNPIISYPGVGPALYGDKTALTRPSAFDRINVRMLFITLEKSISIAARYQLFELNDAFTRAQFVAMVEPYLREVLARRGLTDFKVVCDETNNTAEIIDSNQFVGDIYLKPSRSINFIRLNFVAVRTGVDFNTIVQ